MQTELSLDLMELEQLRVSIKRPENQKWIDQRIASLKSKTDVKENVDKSPKTNITGLLSKTSVGAITVTNYSYDQDNKKVKIYLSFENIAHELIPEKISEKFSENSIEVTINGYKGKDYFFCVKRLYASIVPVESKIVLKTNTLVISLTKKEHKNWDGLVYKEDKLKDSTKELETKDPEAGLMGLMKKMYEEGDENMKRTIAETWTKSRDNKK